VAIKGAFWASINIFRSRKSYSRRLYSVKWVLAIIFKAKSLHDSLWRTKNTSDVPPLPKHLINLKSFMDVGD
jgi:hypothetical protein